ncbi:MAG: hypothetical protein CM1200mP26_19930 [Acidimicrobiales bacterium]|nr:MAG: hypothetical protein CM1200mP26_19930 [Acidimicrobiales bacterium]
MLGDPDRTAALARASGGLANVANSRSRIHRIFLEKVLGVHRDKDLPKFSRTTFTSWARRRGLVPDDPATGEAVLFPTCYVEHNEPEVGRDTVAVLERNGVDITCETGARPVAECQHGSQVIWTPCGNGPPRTSTGWSPT